MKGVISFPQRHAALRPHFKAQLDCVLDIPNRLGAGSSLAPAARNRRIFDDPHAIFVAVNGYFEPHGVFLAASRFLSSFISPTTSKTIARIDAICTTPSRLPKIRNSNTIRKPKISPGGSNAVLIGRYRTIPAAVASAQRLIHQTLG